MGFPFYDQHSQQEVAELLLVVDICMEHFNVVRFPYRWSSQNHLLWTPAPQPLMGFDRLWMLTVSREPELIGMVKGLVKFLTAVRTRWTDSSPFLTLAFSSLRCLPALGQSVSLMMLTISMLWITTEDGVSEPVWSCSPVLPSSLVDLMATGVVKREKRRRRKTRTSWLWLV